MEMFFIVVIGLACAFVIWRFLLQRRKSSKENLDTFICPNCGERHCDCHKTTGATS